MATEYVKTTVNIYFDPGKVACAYCPLLETYSRDMCRLTVVYITDRRVTGRWCPLKEENDEQI